MAKGYAKELVGVLDGTLTPAAKLDSRVQGAKQRVFRAVLDLSDANVKRASGDTNVLARIPAGYLVKDITMLASATMGTSTIAVGNATTAGKYRAAATFTAVDTPTDVMIASAAVADPLTTDEDVLMTVGTAALPSSGYLVFFINCIGR